VTSLYKQNTFSFHPLCALAISLGLHCVRRLLESVEPKTWLVELAVLGGRREGSVEAVNVWVTGFGWSLSALAVLVWL
jgi:hypothetical protein